MGFWSDVWSSVKQVVIEPSEELDWARTLNDDGLPLLRIKIRNYLRTATEEDRRKKAVNLARRTQLSSTDELNTLFVKVFAVYQDEVARK